MDEKLEIKTIRELYKYSFYIPSYQRGYRWGKQETKDLLDDIDNFEPQQIRNTNEKTWYCLQPIVVKNRNENEYEVIDGQQRLTTIYLILHYLNRAFIKEDQEKLFKIDYQTREKTKEFLEELGTENLKNKKNDNIDFYYISQAYNTIEEWFIKKGKR